MGFQAACFHLFSGRGFWELDLCHGAAHNVSMATTFDPDVGKATRWKKGQRSPNPGGRPKSRLLTQAVVAKLGEVKPGDSGGRTYAEVIAENLVELASSQGRSAVAAISEIVDRTEGKARQSLEVTDVTADLRRRSDEELRFYLNHDRWPEDWELAIADSTPKAIV